MEIGSNHCVQVNFLFKLLTFSFFSADAKISDLRAAAVASAAALSAASGHPMFLSGSATTGYLLLSLTLL